MMKHETKVNRLSKKAGCLSVKKCLVNIAVMIFFIIITAGIAQAEANWPRIAYSKDGVPISYEVYGSGEPTLVFVHGWSCDSRYWREQVPYFAKKYRVVTMDLAGHGHSGYSRTAYKMASFGDDVRAVVEATNSRRVILIGHSMGGAVIAEAALLMPDRVIGLIGADTFSNIKYPLTREQFKKMIAPMEKDFRAGSRQFVSGMILPATDPQLREWILDDMSAATPAVALSAMNEMMSQYITGEASRIFDRIRIPVIAVNADLWPINYEANRRHMLSFEAIVIKGADHFLMMNRPEEFNGALEKAVNKLSAKPAK